MVKGSVNFLFLPDRRCYMAACGGSISNVSCNISIASSSSWVVRPGSSRRRLLILVQVTSMCGGRTQNDVCRVSNSFVDCSQFPKRCVFTVGFEENLVSWVISFCENSRGPTQTCLLWQQFSKTGRIFRANIVSAGDVASSVFGFGVIR